MIDLRCRFGKHAWSWVIQVQMMRNSSGRSELHVRHQCERCSQVSEWFPSAERIKWRCKRGLLPMKGYYPMVARIQRVERIATLCSLGILAGSISVFVLYHDVLTAALLLMCAAGCYVVSMAAARDAEDELKRSL